MAFADFLVCTLIQVTSLNWTQSALTRDREAGQRQHSSR